MSQRVSTRPPAEHRGRWSRGWRRWAKWLATLGAVLFVLGLLGFAYAYAAIDIPDPNEGFETQTTYVYYADGRTELGKFAEQDRTSVPLSQIPLHVQEAVIAAEDRSFRTNRGIDPKGILRAAFNNARGGSTQGASTITQQYVKVLYLTQDRTFTRKLKEAVLSLKIQREKSKDQILEGYLNTIYFGRGAYGVEAAARAYFDTSARQLTVSQGAVLAAVLNSPSYLDPANGPDSRRALLSRYRYVVGAMAETGALPAGISAREARRLPAFPEVRQESQNGGQRGHVLRMVRQELTRLGFSESEIYGGGLRVTTTLTRSAMAAAQQGVLQERPRLPELHVAAASIDPRSGALRGMYAGQDYLDSQLNWAEAGGAPGSAFKPFALAAGLSSGYSLRSTFEGNSPLVIGNDEFENQGEDGGTDYGSAVTLLDATEESVNTAYIDLVASMDGGVEKVIDTAVDLGVPADAPGLEPNLSTVLGSATVSPLDMANAFGSIAAGGRAKEWYVVEAVEGSDGTVQFKQRIRTTQAVSEEVAADTSYALQQVTEVGTGINAQLADRPVAGKTGTATSDDGRVRSSWFVGYTPQLATAVMYVRGNGNAPLDGYLDTFYGGQHPALTWQAIMTRALAGAEVVPFPPPANLVQTAEGGEAPVPAPAPTVPAPAPSPTASSVPPSDTPSPTPSRSASPSSTPEPSPSTTPSPSPTRTPSPTGNPPPTPTRTPSPTAPPTGGGGGRGGGGG